MAYDTVVDKTKLEKALGASANAIRQKTGKTGKIQWDSVRGFADEISVISSGGGGITPTDTISITSNGTHDVTNYASAEVNVCGQYIWEKSKPTEWGVTSTDLGTTMPSDCGTTRYGTATITDDGHYTLSGSATVGGYYYVKGEETNPKSVYHSTWHYVHNGDSYYTYEKLTISDAPVSGGGLIGYVVSDDEAAYPDGGTQDGYWYVRVTVQEV